MADIHPVTFEKYGSLSWQDPVDFNWTKKELVCPLQVNELWEAMVSLATGFIRQDDKYSLVAILGVGSDVNLMLGKGGSWAGGYLPMCYRNYPFVLARKPDDDLLLCIDEDSGLIGDDGTGHAFFNADKTPSEQIQKIFTAVLNAEKSKQVTQSICEVLQKYDLIKPWKIKVKVENDLVDFDGLYCTDEAALNKLSGEELVEVRDCGGLALAYAQMFSMQLLLKLSQEAEKRISAAMGSIPVKQQQSSPSLSIAESDGNISFDNL